MATSSSRETKNKKGVRITLRVYGKVRTNHAQKVAELGDSKARSRCGRGGRGGIRGSSDLTGSCWKSYREKEGYTGKKLMPKKALPRKDGGGNFSSLSQHVEKRLSTEKLDGQASTRKHASVKKQLKGVVSIFSFFISARKSPGGGKKRDGNEMKKNGGIPLYIEKKGPGSRQRLKPPKKGSDPAEVGEGVGD